MKEISFPGTDIEQILDYFEDGSRVALVEFPNVFGLVAPATELGVYHLNQTKLRKKNKFYGSIVGELSNFIALLRNNPENASLLDSLDLEVFGNSFLRVPFFPSSVSNSVISNGTHQGLLIDGPIHTLARALEKRFAKPEGNSLFRFQHYFAPLCTSANISGDPEGPITDLEKALNFGHQRGVDLFIHTERNPVKSGSYSIFSFEQGRISVKRESSDTHTIMDKVPKFLMDKMLCLSI